MQAHTDADADADTAADADADADGEDEGEDEQALPNNTFPVSILLEAILARQGIDVQEGQTLPPVQRVRAARTTQRPVIRLTSNAHPAHPALHPRRGCQAHARQRRNKHSRSRHAPDAFLTLPRAPPPPSTPLLHVRKVSCTRYPLMKIHIHAQPRERAFECVPASSCSFCFCIIATAAGKRSSRGTSLARSWPIFPLAPHGKRHAV